ncbi:hypothetical protein [Neorhodopirellula pilleata]|uniref:Uncharacterized protein n=1 Tax=Neorhodopirellula pilleata TaxID=2714738 RepID=A0A5C6AWD2_9BACT|nr:hypothetical protein [Neorhodopirellula pilleata]TWU03342.1 hypothetical protein Pla100_02610 [Neorhodopirellula pilleata]
MKIRKLRASFVSQMKTGRDTGIVPNGYANLAAGVNAEARRIVEAKYADQWQAAGVIGRWKLQRVMDAEINELATKLMPDVSSKAVF